MRELKRLSIGKNSYRQYHKKFSSYLRFCRSQRYKVASTSTIEEYGAFLSNTRSMTGANFAGHVSAINFHLKLRNRGFNIDHLPGLRMTRAGMTRKAASQRQIKRVVRRACVRRLIERMIKTLDPNDPLYRWKVIMYLLGHDTLLRSSNIGYIHAHPEWYLTPSDVTFYPNNHQPTKVGINLTGSKTNQNYSEEVRYAHCVCAKHRPCLVHLLLEVWRIRRHFPNKWLFIKPNGKPFTRYDIVQTLEHACTKLGLNKKHYTPHCLRIGGATNLYWNGISIEEIAKRGHWRSDCVLTYLRADNPDLLKLGLTQRTVIRPLPLQRRKLGRKKLWNQRY